MVQSNQSGRRAFLTRLAALPLAAALPCAQAQSWPAKPIRLVVPYPAGGGTDIVARLIAPVMSKNLGQTIVIDNKPGASTIIGTQAVATAPPDGYTIGLITDSHAINPSIFPKLPYDSLRDFEPVSQLVNVPFVLIVNPALSVKSVRELIALAKSRPGKINFASIGNGTPHHLAMEWFKSLAGIDLTHVPYKGVSPAVADVVAGQVDVMFTGMSSGLPFIRAGKLAGLAVSSPNRQSSAPEIPTVAESGLAGFQFMTWYGITAPAGTPKDVVERFAGEIARALAQSDIKERLATLGVEAAPSEPEQFAGFIKKEAIQYIRIIKITGAKSE